MPPGPDALVVTPALVLRQLVPGDAAEFLQLNGEETTRRWLPSHVYADLDEASQAVGYLVAQRMNPGDPRRGPYVIGVVHAASERLIGHVGFSPLRGEVEISYAIAEDVRRRGYATQALTAACQWAAATFGLDTILALTASANIASRRTLARAGFRHRADELMRFQGGEEQSVSIYLWNPAGPSAAHARGT